MTTPDRNRSAGPGRADGSDVSGGIAEPIVTREPPLHGNRLTRVFVVITVSLSLLILLLPLLVRR